MSACPANYPGWQTTEIAPSLQMRCLSDMNQVLMNLYRQSMLGLPLKAREVVAEIRPDMKVYNYPFLPTTLISKGETTHMVSEERERQEKALLISLATLNTRERVVLLRACFPCVGSADISRLVGVSRQRVAQILGALRNNEEWLRTKPPAGCASRYQDERHIWEAFKDKAIDGATAVSLLFDRASFVSRLNKAKEIIGHGRFER